MKLKLLLFILINTIQLGLFAQINPDTPTLSTSFTEVCPGTATTINISGNLNDATDWYIYSGSCGGTLIGTTALSEFVVTPNNPSNTYYIRGEGGATTSTCATITITTNSTDSTDPIITNCPNNMSVIVNANCQFPIPDMSSMITVMDNCTSTPVITQNVAAGFMTTDTIQISITATDGAGNSTSCQFYINPSDTTTPIAICTDTTLYLDANWTASVTGNELGNTSTDNCTISNYSLSQTQFDCTDLGDNATTLTVLDNYGNTASCIATITIIDTISPVINSAMDTTVYCYADVPDTNSLNVSHNCTSTLTWVSDVSDSNSCPETITRTYSLDDGMGNVSTIIQNITVNDTIAPSLNTPNLPQLNAPCGETPVSFQIPNAIDNCLGYINGSSNISFPITTAGITTITWTFTDGCSNTTTQTQDVFVTLIDTSVQVNANTLSANNSNGSYQWINCSDNSTIPGATGQSYTATANGSYAVIITEGSCSATSACRSITTVGIDEIETGEVKIFPNPTTTTVTLDLHNFDLPCELEIFDFKGTIVRKQVLTDESTKILLPEDDGVYHFKIIQKNHVSAFKVIKQ